LVASAASNDVPRITLSLSKTIPTDLANGTAYEAPVRCDTNGNMYIRFYQQNPDAAPIVKVGPDGKLAAEPVRLELVKELAKGGAIDFSVNANGEVSVLGVDDKNHFFIANFDSQGQHKGITWLVLDADFVPWHYGIFSSGEILLTGGVKMNSHPEPRALLLDKNGNSLHAVGTDEKLESDKNGKIDEALSKFQLSTVVPGTEGNMYVLRPGAKPIVLVISPSGLIRDRWIVDSPGEGYLAQEIKVAAGNVVVVFLYKRPPGPQTSVEEVYRVLNSFTGEIRFDYVPDPTSKLRGAFTCYRPPADFSLLSGGTEGGTEGKLILQWATPK
jgi:hypothetical protein